ncbi:hypothetical protein BBF96_13840 [Anoxybacter fermentans]|uniref:Uncharacterized protein n=1 Tax=Anoxybacter fermentans TaxID=1323375 RepID=A0A3Q9HS86_9FIRM|nr:hypothetical protein BBF96_13840 [Anoxybacter fermentans]
MKDLAKGYAIPVNSFQEIEPVTLDELKTIFPDFIPPQSYLILKKPDLLKFLLGRKRIGEKIYQT